MMWEIVIAVSTGILGAVAGATALAAALEYRGWRRVLSAESVVLLGVALVSAWCVVESVYMQAHLVHLVLMLVAASQAVRMLYAAERVQRSSRRGGEWKTRQRTRT